MLHAADTLPRSNSARSFTVEWMSAICLIAGCAHSISAAATFNEVKAAYQPSDTLILDRHGEVLHRLRTDASVRRGQWVALADISPALAHGAGAE
jgi:membrane peptidoglycan carboxypeptidase